MSLSLYGNKSTQVHRQALAGGNLDIERTEGSRGGRPALAVMGQTVTGAGVMPVPGLQSQNSPESQLQHSGGAGVSLSSIKSSLDPLLRRIAECCKRGVKGHCGNHPEEHAQYIMPVLCMQQQCPDCGQDDSKAHRRRWERWTGRPGKIVGKVTQLASMGYWVIELPERLRSDVTLSWSAKGLRTFRKQVMSVLAGKHGRKGRQGGFSDRGLWSFHFFGDYHGLVSGHIVNVDALQGQKYFEAFKNLLADLSALGCVSMVVNPNKPRTIYWHPNGERLGDQSRMVAKFAKKYGFKLRGYSEIKWNPHLNVLTDSGYVDSETLEATKRAIREAIGAEDVIIHYSYVSRPAQMVHKVKYVVRSTFLDFAWSPYMAHQLSGFVNMGKWGKWDGQQVWTMTSAVEGDAKAESIAAALEKHECPECHGPWIWQRKIESMTLAECEGAVPVGNTGYYKLPGKRFEPDTLAPTVSDRLADLERTTEGLWRSNAGVFAAACDSRLKHPPGTEGFFSRSDMIILWKYARERQYEAVEHETQAQN